MEGIEGSNGKEIRVWIPGGFNDEGRYQVVIPGSGVDSGKYYVDTRPVDYGMAATREPEPQDYEWETLYRKTPDNAIQVQDSDTKLTLDLLPQGKVWRLRELLEDPQGTHAKIVHEKIVELAQRGASLSEIEEAVDELL